MGSAVETVLADSHLLVVLGIDRVHAGAIGHGGDMEGRVEDTDIGNSLEDLLAGLDATEVGGHVQGTELHELLRLSHIGLVHERGIAEHLAAMENAMPDRIDALSLVAEIGDDLLESFGVILRAAATDALDEALRQPLALLHVEELILERTRTRVDNENFIDCLFHFSFCLYRKLTARPLPRP